MIAIEAKVPIAACRWSAGRQGRRSRRAAFSCRASVSCFPGRGRRVALEALRHSGEERSGRRLGNAMEESSVELPAQLAEGRLVRGREGEAASLEVHRRNLQVAVQHRKEACQLARPPSERHHERLAALVRRSERHPDLAGRQPAGPCRSQAQVEVPAVLLRRGREGREPAFVADETGPSKGERTRNICELLKQKAQASTPTVTEQGTRRSRHWLGAKGPSAPEGGTSRRGCSRALSTPRCPRQKPAPRRRLWLQC